MCGGPYIISIRLICIYILIISLAKQLYPRAMHGRISYFSLSNFLLLFTVIFILFSLICIISRQKSQEEIKFEINGSVPENALQYALQLCSNTFRTITEVEVYFIFK